jgi:UMF1 family MFS transporter
VTGWILFDFATTVFSFVVVTRYLNDWILDERGAPDIVIGLMSAAVSVALVLTLPALGARADRTGRHMPILIPFSVLSITATALLGLVGPTWVALAVAGVAIFAFYVADAQYHPLLATIAAPAHQGRVSGAGVAVGLVGSLVALGLLGAIVDEGHAQQAFLPAAALYGAFALPMLLLLREEPRAEVAAPDGPGPSGLRRLLDGIGRARGRPYGRLLLARFLYVDAVATAIQFMAVYARRTGDFD